MNCSVKNCPGEYEEKKIYHTVKMHNQVVVIDHVPAEVCSICGDVLLKPDTVRQIEKLLKKPVSPTKRIPLYEYDNPALR